MSHLSKPSFFSRLRSKSRSKSPAPYASKPTAAPPASSGSSSSQTVSLPVPVQQQSPPAGQQAGHGQSNQSTPIPVIIKPPGQPNQNSPGSSKPLSNLPAGAPPSSINKKPSLWDEALSKLAQADQDQIKSQGGDKLDILKSILKAAEDAKTIAHEKAWKIKWKGEDIVIRDITEKIIVWVKKFKEVGDTIVQYDPGHAALPWAAVRFLLQVTIQDVENRGNVLIGIEKVSKIISRCSAMEQVYLHSHAPNSTSENDFKEDLVSLYSGILKFLAKAKEFFTQSIAGRIKTSILQSDFHDKYLSDVDLFESDLLKRASIMDTELLQDMNETQKSEFSAIRSLIDGFDAPIARIDARLEKMADDLDAFRRSEILEWLSITDYSSVHESVRKSITAGTCKWLHKDTKFTNWRTSSSSSIFWLRGNPGCGKTRLTGSVIKLLLEYRQKSSSQEAIAYFYVDKTREQTGNHDTVVSAIAKQLAAVHPDAPIQPPVVDMFKDREKAGRKSEAPSFDEACQLITELTKIYPQTCIVVDALDEMNNEDGQWELVEFLKKLIDTSSGLIKIFLSSRPNEAQLNTLLSDVCKHYITLGDNGADIEQFVKSTLDKLVDSRRLLKGKLPDTTRAQIIKTLTTKADGMFLWVSLQMQELIRLRSSTEVEARLRTIPLGISNLYQDIYRKIFSDGGGLDQKVARLAFQWILGAVTPISPPLLLGLLERHHQVDDLSTEDILSICRNILTLEKDTLVFTHLTAKDFILSQADFSLVACRKDVALQTLPLLISILRSPAHTFESIVENELENDMQSLKMSLAEAFAAHRPPQTPIFYALCFWTGQIQLAGGDKDNDLYQTIGEIMGTQSRPSDLFEKLVRYYSTQYPGQGIGQNIWRSGRVSGDFRLKHRQLSDFCRRMSSEDYTPLEIAIASSFPRYALWILDNEPPTADFIYEKQILQHSAKFYRADDGECFKKLLSLSAPENLRLFELFPIFEIFAQGGATDIAVHTMEHLKNVASGLKLDTELLYASLLCLALNHEVGPAFILPILLQKPTLQPEYFDNPFLFMIYWNMEEPSRLNVVKLLLDHGYNINTLLTIKPWWLEGDPQLSMSTLEAFVALNKYPWGWHNFFQLLSNYGISFSNPAAKVTSSIVGAHQGQMADLSPDLGHEAPKTKDFNTTQKSNLLELLLHRYLAELGQIFPRDNQQPIRRGPSLPHFQKNDDKLSLEQVISTIKIAIKCGAIVDNSTIMRAAHLEWIGVPEILQEIKRARPDASAVIRATIDFCQKAIITKAPNDLKVLSQYIQYNGVDIGASSTGKLEDSLVGLALAKEERLCDQKISPAAFQICTWGSARRSPWPTTEECFNSLLNSDNQQMREYLLKRGVVETGDGQRSINTLPWPHILTTQTQFNYKLRKLMERYCEPGSDVPIDPKLSQFAKSRRDSVDRFFDELLENLKDEELEDENVEDEKL
ncbi:Vegetative incompatibility protein [Drechslerella dactyloides]|uniref:Vegetative incompatibility protein n=1 Tax=Drechslerella dactyloides TaxID=74499 RepID=A0AAD6NN56_DREDA|nr:Vegetative incompatibility protein [Drechslerella dactyloides]